MPAYTANEDAFKYAKRLIDGRQYVLRSRWQDVQPRAREQNAFLKTHSWEEYAAWHLGLTKGAPEDAKSRYAFVYAPNAGCTNCGNELDVGSTKLLPPCPECGNGPT